MRLLPPLSRPRQQRASRRAQAAADPSSCPPPAFRSGRPAAPAPRPRLFEPVAVAAEPTGMSTEQRELLCSAIGLAVKFGLVAVVGVSLCRVALAYQERMERQRELSAVLEIEAAKLNRARARFDQLFMKGGEQRLVREQAQWIAPNRLRVVWRDPEPAAPFPSVEQTGPVASSKAANP